MLRNNSGSHGGSVLRAVGDDYEPRAFSTYSPCAIALIGKVPDTLCERRSNLSQARAIERNHEPAIRQVKAARALLGWSQSDLARHSGVSEPARSAMALDTQYSNRSNYDT